MNTPPLIDLLIIGAGPAGLSCAIEAGNAGLKYLVVDKGGIAHSIQGFQRDMYFFSTPELLEIGGVPFVVPTTRPTSLDCVNYYRSVVQHHRIECCFYEHITSIERQDNGFIARTGRGNEIRSRFVVVATGYYDTPNLLNVPGEQLPHVTHYYRDPLPYFGQEVLIVGGKNSAVEAALDLWRHGAKVTVVHRGPSLSTGIKYWVLPDFENRVANGSIVLHRGVRVREFLPSKAILADSNGKSSEVRTDFVFVLIGYRPDIRFLQSLGIKIDEESLAPQFDTLTMETNVPGLYVAGGIVGGKYNNKVFIENGREHGKKIIPSIVNRS
jgi:thioredoxin reductase (NADPH)